ncbi:MAG: PIN domain-containing protein [Nanoarchaeota archaeon]
MLIIPDSNILISAIIKNSITRSIILSSDNKFLLPEYSLTEIKRHEMEILYKSGLSKEEFNLMMKKLVKYIRIVKTDEIIRYREKADKIIGKIDEDDVLFIACALAFPKSIIWSNDEHFKLQKIIKTYNTKELIEFILPK